VAVSSPTAGLTDTVGQVLTPVGQLVELLLVTEDPIV
jgi:hypothetical protein